MLKNLILVGFMGTGKSTIGRQLSKALGYPLIDTDARIVAQQKRPIADIFESEGEDHFRHLETETLRTLQTTSATNASSPPAGASSYAKKTGISYATSASSSGSSPNPKPFSSAPPAIASAPFSKPKDPEETIRLMLEQRDACYRESAHLILETTNLDFAEITTGIIECARYHYGSQ